MVRRDAGIRRLRKIMTSKALRQARDARFMPMIPAVEFFGFSYNLS